MLSETIKYNTQGNEFHGYAACSDRTKRAPGVLVCHPWAGRSEFACQKAKALADLGYVGFALDLYGGAKVGGSDEECLSLMQPLVQNRALLLERLKSGLAALRSLPYVQADKIAAIGFCFGGLCALDLARSGEDLKGVVSFHGLLHPPSETKTKKIKAKVLALHGHDDPMVKPDAVLAFQKEMTEAGADWQFVSYGHTMHAFTNPLASDANFGTVFNPAADARSWIAMKIFLAEVLA